MITESDLRAVLTDEARDVSEPAEILARLHVAERQPTAKRRWLAPLAAAAAVAAAVVVAGTLVVDHRAGHSDQPASTRPSALGRDLWFTPYVHPIEGYDVTAISMDNSAVGIGVRYPGHPTARRARSRRTRPVSGIQPSRRGASGSPCRAGRPITG